LSPTTIFIFIAGMAVLGFADLAIKQTSGKISPALGLIVFREGWNTQFLVGLSLAAAGIFLIATR
jgi:hypothetical protein